MIYNLRKKFIRLTVLCVVAVFFLMFILICIFSINQLNAAMDMITDRVAQSLGEPEKINTTPPPRTEDFPGFITEEARDSTRYFTVEIDTNNNIVAVNVDSISSVTKEEAKNYVLDTIEKNETRGWIKYYRYKIFDTDSGRMIVFVDGSMNRSVSGMTLLTAGSVLVGSMTIIIILIIIFSKRAVRPIAESYEKQKQFITDANHELKTPLTLILTNLDILEAELGKNEWLDDIRAEGERMDALVKQLVTLTRMDEDGEILARETFSLSDMVEDVVSEFTALADEKKIRLSTSVQKEIKYTGDESALRRVVYILMDNAVKYCDKNGSIEFKLSGSKKPVIIVENSYEAVDEAELGRLFDRFYRSDRSRTFTGGFGIGLSIAKSIVIRHHGEIFAYKKGQDRIGFRIVLK